MMKKSSPIMFSGALVAAGRATTIKIDVARVIDQVDPQTYGAFVEPIGFNRPRIKCCTRCGGLSNPKSQLAAKHGFRKDMIEAARELRVTNMRPDGRDKPVLERASTPPSVAPPVLGHRLAGSGKFARIFRIALPGREPIPSVLSTAFA